MMRSVFVTVLFVAGAQTEGLTASYKGDMQGSVAKLVDHLVDELSNRAIKVSNLHRAQLDMTTLGKSGHAAMSPSTIAHGIRYIRPNIPYKPSFHNTRLMLFQNGEATPRNLQVTATDSSSVVVNDNLEERIQAKGDEIRALKASGADKKTVQPLVDELLALKAQTTPVPSETAASSLEERIQAKGDEIRALKASGADKNTVQPLVDELLALKAQLTNPAASDASTTSNLEEQIKAKGDEIRAMKASGADKKKVQPLVHELIALKTQLESVEHTTAEPSAAEKLEKKKKEVLDDIESVEGDADYFGVHDADGKVQFGNYKVMASQEKDDPYEYADVKMLGLPEGPAIGTTVRIRGRVAAARGKGKACFTVIRSDAFYTVQACFFKVPENADVSKDFIKFVGNVPQESIVDVVGVLTAAEVTGCSQKTVEIQMTKFFVVSRAPAVLPFLLEDAARKQADIDKSQETDRPFASVAQDTRLDYRWLDLRVPANNAIMRIRSGISLLFREALSNQGFIEINTPKLIEGGSEGGSEVFMTDYFGRSACLAQSPQLYKQMAVASDLERVFEIGPVFRAEKSQTRRHLCEFTGLDFEMAIKSHYNEALAVIHSLFKHIFNGLEERYAKELATVREQYPSEPVQFTEAPLVLHWTDAIAMLKDSGEQIEDEFDDLSDPMELKLGKLVKKRYNADFFALDQYPSKVRPFYTMPNMSDTRYSNSYDVFIRGQEICSGAQRCHDLPMLLQNLKDKEMSPDSLLCYLQAFKHGVSPHAGGGIGLDRVLFLYLGLDNVRKASMFPRDPNRCSP